MNKKRYLSPATRIVSLHELESAVICSSDIDMEGESQGQSQGIDVTDTDGTLFNGLWEE